MPDQYGFNHLGDTVRCIDCPGGGLLRQWPDVVSRPVAGDRATGSG
jgi:hypothetical protein